MKNAVITNYPFPGYINPTGTTTTVTFYVDDSSKSGVDSSGVITITTDTADMYSRSVTLLIPVSVDSAP